MLKSPDAPINAAESHDGKTLCPVARTARVIGDRWSMLIVRELFMGVHRFHDLQAQTGATAQLLAARLKQLQADGLIERRPYSSKPVRYEYLLTAMGRDLRPLILALRVFGETWCKTPDEGVAVRMSHLVCGSELALDGTCPACARPVDWSEMKSEPTPAYQAERARRAASFAARQARPSVIAG